MTSLTQQQGGEQEAGDVDRIYCEARECENCGHAGINDSHTVNAACLECDWSGPSPQEDKCPTCQQSGVMTAACPRCEGRYRLVAEAEIPALRSKPAASEGDGRACDFQTAVALEVGADEENQGDIIRHVRAWVASAKGQSAPNNTSKQAAGEAVAEVGNDGAVMWLSIPPCNAGTKLYAEPRHPADEGAVDDSMVERAADAYEAAAESEGFGRVEGSERVTHLRFIRAAIDAALQARTL